MNKPEQLFNDSLEDIKQEKTLKEDEYLILYKSKDSEDYSFVWNDDVSFYDLFTFIKFLYRNLLPLLIERELKK